MNSLEVGIRLVAGVLLILANGFFVAIEFALTRARQFTEEEFVGDGHRALEWAWEMTHNLEIYLTTCQETTLTRSDEQWDAPNGWAPLQWMAVVGLKAYGHGQLAEQIAGRWLDLNRTMFDETGLMLEKYDVSGGHGKGQGGEYPLQYGFGWTNGVALALPRLFY